MNSKRMKNALSALSWKVLSRGPTNEQFFPPCICFYRYSFLQLTICVTMLISISLFPSAHCQAVQAENVTVLEGGTAQISCRLQNYDGSIVVIQNPRRQTLFFNGTRGVYACTDKLICISNLNPSSLTRSIFTEAHLISCRSQPKHRLLNSRKSIAQHSSHNPQLISRWDQNPLKCPINTWPCELHIF